MPLYNLISFCGPQNAQTLRRLYFSQRGSSIKQFFGSEKMFDAPPFGRPPRARYGLRSIKLNIPLVRKRQREDNRLIAAGNIKFIVAATVCSRLTAILISTRRPRPNPPRQRTEDFVSPFINIMKFTSAHKSVS